MPKRDIQRLLVLIIMNVPVAFVAWPLIGFISYLQPTHAAAEHFRHAWAYRSMLWIFITFMVAFCPWFSWNQPGYGTDRKS